MLSYLLLCQTNLVYLFRYEIYNTKKRGAGIFRIVNEDKLE